MKRRYRWTSLIILCLLLLIPACAHAPLNMGESGDLATAVLIAPPEKSYVIYGHLHEPDEIAYYRFDIAAGQTLHAGLLVNSRSTTAPDLIIMGPGIPSSGTPPAALQTPPGGGVVVIPGRLPERPGYEPFSPAALDQVASYTTGVPTSGTYYVAVVSSAGEQDYSFAPGFKEEFTAAEWLLVPVSVIGGHAWEGQSPFIVLAPCIALVLLGIALLLRQQRRTGISRSPFSWCAITAGLLYLGGASITFTQMVRALDITGWDTSALLTLLFIIIPVVLGIAAIRAGFGTDKTRPVTARISLGIIGMLGLLFWAGLIIGPVIAFVAAILPEQLNGRWPSP
jgi:hypothetical protein